MNGNRPPGFFVTGTDTGVGKTRVAARMADYLHRHDYRVGVYKPVASGCRQEEGGLVAPDAVELWQAAGSVGLLADVCPQRFAAPLAPHLAAAAEGQVIDADLLRDGIGSWTASSDVVIVEGAGGLMSPIGEDYVADLADDLGYPLVVVVPNVLGAINQTLQTLITAATFRDGLTIAGIVLNHTSLAGDLSSDSNRSELEERCVPPILAELAWNADTFDVEIDWMKLARELCIP